MGGIKYLLKFDCKGNDTVEVDLTGHSGNQPYDEIRQFHDAQYLSASKAP